MIKMTGGEQGERTSGVVNAENERVRGERERFFADENTRTLIVSRLCVFVSVRNGADETNENNAFSCFSGVVYDIRDRRLRTGDRFLRNTDGKEQIF